MGYIAGGQFKSMSYRNGGDHRIGGADGLAGTFKIASNFAGELPGRLVERQNFLAADLRQEFLNAARALHPL